MDTERTIAEIEYLERIFAVPDNRPLNGSDLAAANQRYDEMLAQSPWFRIWQRYGGLLPIRGSIDPTARIVEAQPSSGSLFTTHPNRRRADKRPLARKNTSPQSFASIPHASSKSWGTYLLSLCFFAHSFNVTEL